MPEMTAKEFFGKLEPKLNSKPELLDGMDCIFRFMVGDFAYNVSVKDGKATVSEGETLSPNCTVIVSENDFIDMLAGRLSGQTAFFTGRLKVAGDIGLALKLESFIG